MKHMTREASKSGIRQRVRCLPQGICSWDFRLTSSDHVGRVEFGGGESRGTVRADGIAYTIQRQGWMSDCWKMSKQGQEIWRADKVGWFGWNFVFTSSRERLRLQADSLIGRSFSLYRDTCRVVQISPEHPFTRRATMQLRGDVAFPDACFAFWIVALLWRRLQND